MQEPNRPLENLVDTLVGTLVLRGREDEGQEGQDPPAPPPPSQEESGTDEPETFDRDYVEKLRSENAKRRSRERELEEKLEAYEKERMSDLEKAQSAATEAQERLASIETELRQERFRNAVISQASASQFTDPEDAVRMIDPSTVTVDEETGIPNRQSLEAAVKKLVAAKPYLVAQTTGGSGEGGSRGSGGGGEEAERIRSISQNIERRGGVPISR